MKTRLGGGRIVPHEQTDGRTVMTKLIVDFKNFVNALKIYKFTQMTRSFLLKTSVEYSYQLFLLCRTKNYGRKCDTRL